MTHFELERAVRAALRYRLPLVRNAIRDTMELERRCPVFSVVCQGELTTLHDAGVGERHDGPRLGVTRDRDPTPLRLRLIPLVASLAAGCVGIVVC